jgi:hypothetical protein
LEGKFGSVTNEVKEDLLVAFLVGEYHLWEAGLDIED